MRRFPILVVTSLLACTPIDVDRGYGFSCKRDGDSPAQCPGDYHCGLENKCIRNEPGRWLCDSDIDCYGWHCGVDRRCYDLVDAGAVPCRDNRDCDKSNGWQCGPDGDCVDTRLELPRSASAEQLEYRFGTRELWAGEPVFAEVAESRTSFPDGGLCVSTSIFVGDAEEVVRISVPGFMASCTKAPSFVRTHLGGARAIANDDGNLVALMNDSVLSRSFEDTEAPVHVDSVPGAQRLRLDAHGWTAFGPDVLYRQVGDAGWSLHPDAGVIRDVAFVGSPGDADYRVAVLSEVFQTAPVGPAGPLGPLRTEGISSNSTCTAAAGTLSRMAYTDESFVALDYRALSLRTEPSDGTCDETTSPWTLHVNGQVLVHSNCRQSFVDRGGSRGQCVLDGSVLSWPSSGSASAVVLDTKVTAASEAQLVNAAYAGRFPAVFVQRSGTNGPPGPALWNSAPDFSTVTDGVITVWKNGTAGGPAGRVGLVGEELIVSEGTPFPGTGFAIRGAPQLVGFQSSSRITLVDLGGFASVELLEDDAIPDAVSVASSARLPNGDSLVLIGRGDVVSNVVLDGLGQQTLVRNGFAPAPRLHVRALDIAEDLLGAEFAGGYAVAGGRVFRFTADNPIVWRSTELPVGAVEAIDVWHDGHRGRAGLRDGTVVGLPSRVPISPPTQGVANHFLQVCERLFVASSQGVDVLVVPPGATEGTWTRVVARADAARLHFADSVLTVFFADGSFGRISVPDCAQ